MELFIALFAGFSLITFSFLVIVSGIGKQRNETLPPQTDWDADQLLVVNMLELSKYRKDDTLYVHTQRAPDGKTLVFNVAIWWPVFTDINTQKVTVFNVKSASNHVLIGGTIGL